MRMYDVIAKKRDGGKLTKEEIDFFVKGYTSNDVPDYQASALAMAIFIKGMDAEETTFLTQAMMHSGETVDLSNIKGIKVDKHSTGGVGDTTTLVLGPLVAACDVPVAKMSGRGLGHTGGTLDKLEAIPGFDINLSIDDFIDAVNRHKIAVIGQTKDIAPADKKLYALRDVTATVDNISLISASIMSKKLAAGSDAIVLDVKMGSGAFIKTFDQAELLAKTMVELGTAIGRNVIGVITSMEQPLGEAIGNSLEVIEAIETLKGKGPEDLTELCLTLGANMLLCAHRVATFEEGVALLKEKISSGEALEKFKEFVTNQKGNAAVVDDYGLMKQPKHRIEYTAQADGYILDTKADEIGIASMILGAGRKEITSPIDLSAGILLKKKIGDVV
ncbi:MAG: pyrimidine-nucleoside phosphorylase, partial [Clostridia bacterium]|nr:pyrimidine-nucleoside phosphorylase [Clostridia bacterium]